MNRKKFNEEEEKKIVDRYLSGETIKAIAVSLNANCQVISHILQRNAVWRDRHAVSTDTERAIVKGFKSGEAIYILADRYGVGHDKVASIIDKHKLETELTL